MEKQRGHSSPRSCSTYGALITQYTRMPTKKSKNTSLGWADKSFLFWRPTRSLCQTGSSTVWKWCCSTIWRQPTTIKYSSQTTARWLTPLTLRLKWTRVTCSLQSDSTTNSSTQKWWSSCTARPATSPTQTGTGLCLRWTSLVTQSLFMTPAIGSKGLLKPSKSSRKLLSSLSFATLCKIRIL